MTTIRVLLADDHAVLRAGLRMLINADGSISEAEGAGRGAGATIGNFRFWILDFRWRQPGGGLRSGAHGCRRRRKQPADDFIDADALGFGAVIQ